MENEKLHIGRIVESAFKKSNLTKSEFARRLGVYPQNLQRMFEKDLRNLLFITNSPFCYDFFIFLTLT